MRNNELKSSSPALAATCLEGRKRIWVGPTLVTFTFLLFALVLDNTFMYVVTATYAPAHDLYREPRPLQDNGYRLLAALGAERRTATTWQWRLVEPPYLIAAFFGGMVSTKVARDPARYLVYARVLFSIAASRAVRTVAYVATVLPSPLRKCVVRRFGPTTNYGKLPVFRAEWLNSLTRALAPHPKGGCHDLILSGHASVVAVFACATVAMLPAGRKSRCWAALLVISLALNALNEVASQMHYTVDVWCGVVVSALLWHSSAGCRFTSQSSCTFILIWQKATV